MSFESIITFLVIVLVATATPGPTMLYIASCGLSHGRKGYLPASLGVLLADLLYFLITVTGLGVVLPASYEAFFFIKWLGVAYLLYLGVRLLLSDPATNLEKGALPSSEAIFYHAFLKGFIVHLANPKTILFFSALLPQFIDAEKPMLLQVVVMGLILLITQAFMAIVYGLLGGRIQRGVKTSLMARKINVISGSLFIVAGCWLAAVRRD